MRRRSVDGEPGLDPRAVLEGSRVPMLWLLGDRDRSVPTGASTRALVSLEDEAAGPHVVIRYPDAGHDLRAARSGNSLPLWDDLEPWMRGIGVLTE